MSIIARMPAVSVIIPTFDGQHLLSQNLSAVMLSTRDGDELLIVDDASQDMTVEWLCQGFKLQEQRKPDLEDAFGQYRLFVGFYQSHGKKIAITLLANQKNLRFAVSCNRGVKQATHSLVWLINNDVTPAPDCLKHLVKHFVVTQPNQPILTNLAKPTGAKPVFAVGCLEYEGKDNQALKAGKNRLWFAKGLYLHSKANDFEFGPTAWVSGGSGLFDRARFLKLGGFDAKFYPAYWEDIDLSFRARQKHWQVLFEPQAQVFHRHESTNKAVFGQEKIKHLSLSQQRYFTLKHANFWQKIQFLFWQPYWWRKFKHVQTSTKN